MSLFMVKESFNSMYSRALVTGASAGLGEGFVRMLLDEGLEVWGTSRRPEQLPQRDRFHSVKLDLRDADSLKVFLDTVLRQGPPFDLVINNAGYGAFYPFEKFPENEIGGQIDVLLSGPIKICRQVYAGMHRRGYGVLVNISSLAAEFPMPCMSLYNASKSGLSGFSRSLILESQGSGVAVIDFQPGDFRTAFNSSIKRDPVLGEGNPQVSAAWDGIDKMLKSGPPVEIAVQKLRKTLLRARSGTVRTGGFFQAVLSPFMARFLPRKAILWFIRRYYGMR